MNPRYITERAGRLKQSCKTIKKDKKMKKEIIYRFVANDVLRPKFNGVYHDPKVKKAIATNGHIMIGSTADYKEEFSDKIIKKDTTEVFCNNTSPYEHKYCFWDKVLVSHKNSIVSNSIPSISKEYKAKLNDFIELCKSQKIRGAKTDAQITVNIEGVAITFNYNLFKLFLDGAKHIKASTIRVDPNEQYPAIQAENENGDFVILTPMRTNYELNDNDINLKFNYNN